MTQPGDLLDRLDQCARAAAAVLDELVLITRVKPDGELAVVAAAHPSRPDLVEAARLLTPRRVPAELEPRYRAGRAFVLDPTPVELLHDEPGGDTARVALGPHSTLVAPLTVNGRLYGILGIISSRGCDGDRDGDGDGELAMAEELSRRIAGAMEGERVAVLERRLHDASTALAAAATVSEAAAALATAVTESMDATGAAVFTPDADDPSKLRLRHLTDYDPRYSERFAVIRITDDTAPAEAARTGVPVWLPDQQSWRDRYPNLPFTGVMHDVHAMVALPIRIGE